MVRNVRLQSKQGKTGSGGSAECRFPVAGTFFASSLIRFFIEIYKKIDNLAFIPFTIVMRECSLSWYSWNYLSFIQEKKQFKDAQ
jgi:hypothetical protein